MTTKNQAYDNVESKLVTASERRMVTAHGIINNTAINQIKEKRYQGALSGYRDKILLVGVNYDAVGNNKKHHTCVIEEWKE